MHSLSEQLRLFENKYNRSWDSFEKDVKSSKEESLDMWDDYIEWKAYIKMSEELKNKIEEVNS